MFNKIIRTRLGIITITVLSVVISYGFVALADVIINGGNNTVYDSQYQASISPTQKALLDQITVNDDEDIFGGNVTVPGGLCSAGDPGVALCNIDINYLDVTTALAVDGNTTLGDAASDTITVNGATTFNGTTTPSRNTDFSVHEAFSFNGTSTARTTEVAVVDVVNAYNDLWCDAPRLDLYQDFFTFGTKAGAGTTTVAGDISLNATTTTTLIGQHDITTTTEDIIISPWKIYDFTEHSIPDLGVTTTAIGSWYEGGNEYQNNSTGTEWLWKGGEHFVAWFDVGGATSSNSWNTNLGFDGAAYVNFDCRAKY